MFFKKDNPLGYSLLKRCQDANYDCHLVHSPSEVIEQLELMKRLQAVIIVDACCKAVGSSGAAAEKTLSPEKRIPESSLEVLSRLAAYTYGILWYLCHEHCHSSHSYLEVEKVLRT